MGIFAEYTDERGRRCRIYDGAGGLPELERNYRECGESADEEQVMENLMLGPKDVLRFSHGSATGAELSVYAERMEMDRVVGLFVDGGQGTYEEGRERYLRAHPGARARLAGVAQSPEDLLKKQGADKGYTVIDEGGTKYHISGGPPKVEDQPDPEDADQVTVVPRGGVRYVVHGPVAAHAKPDTEKAKTAEAARKELWRIANKLAHLSPADAMLKAVMENPGLLATIMEGEE